MKRDTLEQQLFSWKDWKELDVGDFIFYDVTLKVPVGEFPAGTHFVLAAWMTSQSVLQLDDKEGQFHVFSLNVQAGEKLDALLP